MREPDANHKTWRDEPVVAAMAFAVIFSVVMFVGVSVLIGAAHVEPRAAALGMALTSVVCGAAGARWKPTRRFFSSIFG